MGGLLDNLDVLSAPRVRIDLAGEVAVVREKPNSAPLARLQLDAAGNAPVIEGGEDLQRLTQGLPVQADLHLGDDRLLLRNFRLPRAAGSDIKGAIGFEIERHTPFHASDVAFGWRLAETAGDTRTVTAQVAIAQRRALRPLLTGLSMHNLQVDRLIADTSDGDILIEVPADMAHPRARPQRWRQMLLAAALAAAAVSPLVWLEYRAKQITEAAEGLRDEMLAGRRADGGAMAGDLFDAVVQLRRHPEVIDTVNRLSAILPDGTWLTSLAVDGEEVVIEGVSDDSVRLVRLLEASPQFAGVTYGAPVVRDRGDDSERFVFNMVRTGR